MLERVLIVRLGELAETIANVTNFGGNLIFDTTKPDGTKRKPLDVDRLKNGLAIFYFAKIWFS